MASTPTSAISDGVNSVLTRISDFFHIFDFPFFVSGAVGIGGIILFSLKFVPFSKISIWLSSWFGILLLLISCYVLGLMCFTIGRRINGFRNKFLLHYFNNCLMYHGLRELEVVRYYQSDEFYLKKDSNSEEEQGNPPEERVRNWHLYTRMWQDLVHYRPDSLTLKHLMRFWALAALFDGLAGSFIICSLLSLTLSIFNYTECNFSAITIMSTVLTFIFVFFIYLSLKQGAKYYKYQIEDLVASKAAEMNNIK